MTANLGFWRECVTHPEQVTLRTASTLDAIEELQHLSARAVVADPFQAMTQWLHKAFDDGLISRDEHAGICEEVWRCGLCAKDPT